MAGEAFDLPRNSGLIGQEQEYYLRRVLLEHPERATDPELVYGDAKLEYLRLANDGEVSDIITVANLEKKVAERFLGISDDLQNKYTSVYKPEAYKGEDDTIRIQAAIDACPEFGTVQFSSNKSYFISRLNINKSITIDINGATISTRPTWSTGTAGKPAFNFAGTRGSDRRINGTVMGDIAVTLASESDAAEFVAGDWIVVEDSKKMPRWSGDIPNAYSGRGEIVRIRTVLGAALILEKAVEWDYEGASAIVAKVTPLVNASIINIGLITEVDPGGAFTGNNRAGSAPNLIQFAYCINPLVRNGTFKKWNLHCVNFSYCMNPVVDRCYAENPYRPSVGGHGYFVRFDRCTGGNCKDSTTSGVRHHIDWCGSYDGHSSGNMATNHRFIAYLTHGLGSKRITSDNDTAHCTNANDVYNAGWGVGNNDFGPDYDVRINSFTYDGPGNGIVLGSKSENVEVVNPFIRSGKMGINHNEGSKDLVVKGGTITMTTQVGGTTYALRGDQSAFNARYIGVKLRGYARCRIDNKGSLEVSDLDVLSDVYLSTNALSIGGELEDLRVQKNRFNLNESVATGMIVSVAPTRQYIVEDNLISKAGTKYNLVAADNLRQANNN